jgi:flagellar assembly protein FliH
MTKAFEPSFKPQSKVIFNQWESSSDALNHAPIIDEQELFKQACEKLRAEAKALGYEEGLKAAEQSIQERQKEFTNALNALLQPMHLLDETLIKELVKTMLWICQACIGLELSINPEKLVALFTVIKDELPSLKGNKILALNPEDLEWVHQQTQDNIYAEVQNMLIADANLSRGDFYLQSDQSVVDGQITTRLSNLFSEYVSKADFISSPKTVQE